MERLIRSPGEGVMPREDDPLPEVPTQVGSSDTRKFRQTSELSVSLKRPAGCLGLSPRRKFRHPEVSAEVRTSGIPNKKPCSDLTFWIPIRTVPNSWETWKISLREVLSSHLSSRQTNQSTTSTSTLFTLFSNPNVVHPVIR